MRCPVIGMVGIYRRLVWYRALPERVRSRVLATPWPATWLGLNVGILVAAALVVAAYWSAVFEPHGWGLVWRAVALLIMCTAAYPPVDSLWHRQVRQRAAKPTIPQRGD